MIILWFSCPTARSKYPTSAAFFFRTASCDGHTAFLFLPLPLSSATAQHLAHMSLQQPFIRLREQSCPAHFSNLDPDPDPDRRSSTEPTSFSSERVCLGDRGELLLEDAVSLMSLKSINLVWFVERDWFIFDFHSFVIKRRGNLFLNHSSVERAGDPPIGSDNEHERTRLLH